MGITVGCLLGMLPLMFMKEKEKDKGDKKGVKKDDKKDDDASKKNEAPPIQAK